MRALPYLLVLAMAAPVFAWIFVNAFMIKGTATQFGTGDMIVVVSLTAVMVAAFVLLPRWMHKHMAKTGG